MKRRSRFIPVDFSLSVRRTRAGLGLVTNDPVPKGACIIEYKGRSVPTAEQYTSTSKYLFEVNDRVTIDGRARSNTARYINHSCRPNAEPEIRKGRIYIMARRNIRAGEELTYDYGKEYFDEHIKPYGCRCDKCQQKIKS